MRTLWLVGTVFALAVLPCHSHAQAVVVTVGDSIGPNDSFGGQGVTPISSTAVVHYVVVPEVGGGVVAFMLAIRGPAHWHAGRVSSGPGRSRPGFVTERWQVDAREYDIEFSRDSLRLVTFGRDVDLQKTDLVLVTLAADAGGLPTVELVPRRELIVRSPGGVLSAFMAASPELRLFAGMDRP